MADGITQPCPICGMTTLFYPQDPDYPVHMTLEDRGVGCCNPNCETNEDMEEDDDD